MSPARKRAYIELLIISLIWGCAAPIIKYTLHGFSPAIFLTYRFFISGVIAAITFIFLKIRIPKRPKVWAVVILNGFLITTVSLGLLFLGTDKTTSMEANLISAMSPIVIAAAGAIFLRENVSKRESIGILIALAGTIFTIVGPTLKFDGSLGNFQGNLLILASVIVGAATAIIAKVILRDDVDAIFATNISFIVGFITILPFSLSQIINSKLSIITSVPLSYHLGVAYMAVLSGTLAYYLWHKAEKTIEVGEVNLVAYLYPIIGAPLSVFWLGEKIDSKFIIGCVVVAFGVLLAEWKKRRYNS